METTLSPERVYKTPLYYRDASNAYKAREKAKDIEGYNARNNAYNKKSIEKMKTEDGKFEEFKEKKKEYQKEYMKEYMKIYRLKTKLKKQDEVNIQPPTPLYI